MKKRWIIFCWIMILLVPGVFAQSAKWYPVSTRSSWDLSMTDFCAHPTQCLVNVQGNVAYDNEVQKWFSANTPQQGPRCINSSQYILDYLCDSGNWTTRTKQLALSLLKFAEDSSPTNFVLFCDSYDHTFNQYKYLVGGVLVENYLTKLCSVSGKQVPCVNNVCVIKTPATVAFGVSLNVPVNHEQSFLKALNKSKDLCNSISSTATTFTSCSEGVWYNPSLQSIIYLPAGTITSPASTTQSFLTSPFASINSYVMSVLHNASRVSKNFSYFPKTRLFNRIYVAKNGNRAIFGFLESGLKPDDDPVPLDYLGVQYSNMDIGPNPCLNIVKAYDSKSYCENQTGAGFNVIARHRNAPQGASPLVQAWPSLTGKLRP